MLEKLKICLMVFYLLSIQASEGAIEERLKRDFFNIYTHTAIEARDITSHPVKPEEITYYLYTRKNPLNYTLINPSNPSELINKNVKIVFILHGWTGNRETDWYEGLKDAFLSREEEYYVVQVDWSEPANQFYTISSYNTKDVGKFIGNFVVDLHTNHSIPLENFLFVGHSLGGQASGFVGKRVFELTKKKLPRIVALDPAGPLFSTRPQAERLNRTDAEVVTVLHTDSGTFGFKDSCGTIDFYPNGGNFQPGCTRIDLLDIKSVADPITCDHQRSCQLYIEALLNPDVFVARKCENWYKYTLFMCEKEEQVTLGDLNSKATGNFYFETNRERPYSKKRVLPSLPIPSVVPTLPELPGIVPSLPEIPLNASKKLIKFFQN